VANFPTKHLSAEERSRVTQLSKQYQ
jgi:hypothetical protein